MAVVAGTGEGNNSSVIDTGAGVVQITNEGSGGNSGGGGNVGNPNNIGTVTNTVVDLSQLISIDKSVVNRTYTRGSLSALSPETIVVTNLSNTVVLQVTLSGLAGVSFSPSGFSLAALATQTVSITFDSSVLDKLPEGINTVNAAINVTTNDAITGLTAATITPSTPSIEPLPPPPQIPVPIQIVNALTSDNPNVGVQELPPGVVTPTNSGGGGGSSIDAASVQDLINSGQIPSDLSENDLRAALGLLAE